MTRRFLNLTLADALFSAGLLLVTAVVVWQWHIPALTELKTVQADLLHHRDNEAKLNRLVRSIDIARSRSEELSTRLAHYETELMRTGELDYPSIVSRCQTQCGVSLEQMSPGMESTEGPYSILPMDVSLKGPFQNTLAFLSKLENELPAARFSKLEITAMPNEPNCMMSLQLQIYGTHGAPTNDAADSDTSAAWPGSSKGWPKSPDLGDLRIPTEDQYPTTQAPLMTPRKTAATRRRRQNA